MRKLFTLATTALVLGSCAPEKGYRIEGEAFAGLEGKTVYLQVQDQERKFVSIDSALVTNGAFGLKGSQDSAVIAMLAFPELQDRSVRPVNVVLQDGKIRVKIDTVSSVAGTPLNDSLQQIASVNTAASTRMQEIRSRYKAMQEAGKMTPEVEEQIGREYDILSEEVNAKNLQFVEANKTNVVGAYILARNLNNFSEEQMNGIMQGAAPAFRNSMYGQAAGQYLAGLKRGSVGAMYTNITMPDPEGKEISLSDFVGKGKYVLIDFWASWCGPCRQEMPAVVAAYNEYKDKGFEVVGISFDNNLEAWKKGIQDLNITWPQMSDLKGWQCAASEVYAIRSIPQTLLLDPEGKIIAKNIRGEEIAKTLSQYLK